MNYLIISNSYNILNEEISKVFKKLDDVEIINYEDTTLDEVINLASYMSLFNDTKKMIIKNCSFLSDKTNTDKLEKYLENPNKDTIIVFTFNDKVDERKKIIKIFKDNNAYTYIKPLNYKDISAKLIEKAKKKDYKLSISDANYITFSSLNNYDIALNELDKVLSYYEINKDMTSSDIENIVSKSIDDNSFKFIDSVIKRDINNSFKLLNNLKLFKVEAINILSLLTREYRLMLITKSLLNDNISNLDISKKLLLQDWQLEKILNNSYNYSIRELEDKLLDLADLDYKIKSGKIDKYLGLELFILKG